MGQQPARNYKALSLSLSSDRTQHGSNSHDFQKTHQYHKNLRNSLHLRHETPLYFPCVWRLLSRCAGVGLRCKLLCCSGPGQKFDASPLLGALQRRYTHRNPPLFPAQTHPHLTTSIANPHYNPDYPPLTASFDCQQWQCPHERAFRHPNNDQHSIMNTFTNHTMARTPSEVVETTAQWGKGHWLLLQLPHRPTSRPPQGQQDRHLPARQTNQASLGDISDGHKHSQPPTHRSELQVLCIFCERLGPLSRLLHRRLHSRLA